MGFRQILQRSDRHSHEQVPFAIVVDILQLKAPLAYSQVDDLGQVSRPQKADCPNSLVPDLPAKSRRAAASLPVEPHGELEKLKCQSRFLGKSRRRQKVIPPPRVNHGDVQQTLLHHPRQ